MKYFRSRRFGRGLLRKPSAYDEPISAEIFSVDRLEHYAETLARAQEVSPKAAGVSLHARLRANAGRLNSAYETLLAGIRAAHAVTPAAEWLVDNYYLVDEHVRAVGRDLPPGYYKQLPKLANGPLRGYPRVYGLAWSLVAHGDNRFELDTLVRFCRAYQRVQPLTIGELWAIAITLRVVLIDNLSRLAQGIVHRLELRGQADALADTLLPDASGAAPKATTAQMPEGDDPLPEVFAAQLFQRLRDQDPANTPALHWLHAKLTAQKITADDVVRRELQRQGAVNVSIRNIITSLRLISAVDWAKFFESVSLVDDLLRDQSAYGSFDFASRDLYRHAIEELARRSPHTELEVAQRALNAATNACGAQGRGATPRTPPDSRCEPGYYLVSHGRRALERELDYVVPWDESLARWTRAAGVPGYASAIVLASAAAMAAFFLWVGVAPRPTSARAVLIFLTLIASSEIGAVLVNMWVIRFCRARILPGLELIDGVPPGLRTVVAMPVLLTELADVEDHVRSLEVHYLATQAGDIRYALLSDWPDADSEAADGDEELLRAAARRIARLNDIYGKIDGEDRFLLFHRRRRWNAAQGRWMGWERKRGKLHEFNQLLQGVRDTSFVVLDGRPPQGPAGVRYVISLDADTRLPRAAALKLIGKMAHPLNRAVLDDAGRRVVDGYGILQPRVTPSLPVNADASIFQRVFAGPCGIDPYAFAASDVYQDMFGEGSYTGKGIYDLAAFEGALANRVGENRLLSHDLFEGIYTRCGLASDVEVVEEYPTSYGVAAARLHRWTRGDWQLLPWILGLKGTVPLLGRWKLLDNLRRSLIAPASFLAFALCWAGPMPIEWSLYLLLTIALPVLIPLGARMMPRRTDTLGASYFNSLLADLMHSLSSIALRVAFLADQAWLTADAIVRTLYRIAVSRRLLEWTTAAQSKTGAASTRMGFYRRMYGGVLLAVAAELGLLLAGHAHAWVAVPFLLAWCTAPLLARRVSLPVAGARAESLTEADRQRFRLMARETWSYFETFVTAEHNMLPPDNFQEIPSEVIAHRTSPTNIGLYMLSVVAARDLGWLGALDALDRLEATFATLQRLEKFHGHPYNWYDTRDLRPLDPKYISTVDSGNLAGHLFALEGACREWRGGPLLGPAWVPGTRDTALIMHSAARNLGADRRHYDISPRQLESALAALLKSLDSFGGPSLDDGAKLISLLAQADVIVDIAQTLANERGEGSSAPLLSWGHTLRANLASHLRDARAEDGGSIDLRSRIEALADRARTFALDMQFAFLVDPKRELLSIGYRVTEGELDPSCYDLLASEARLASFVAIAKHDLPVRHWFRLGRLLTAVSRGAALVSWSGSMFEYLMPVLVMREPEGSVLGRTAQLIVRRQIQYGAERKLPWGVSESAFNARDREFTYQYLSFGVPGLGLQRGLGEEAVVAPYATALAAMIVPKSALSNFGRLEKLGARGRFGWYDALDFTPARLPEGSTVVPVRAYMAHHQGMTLVSIANVLENGIMRARFHSGSMIQASELLLQERAPRESDLSPPGLDEVQSMPEVREQWAALPRRFDSPHHEAPRTHLLSNGNYCVMVTVAGSGYSRWRDIAVTRWREDPTCDPWGCFVYLRDVGNGQVWSAGYQPVGREPDSYEVAFFEDRAEFVRKDGSMVTATEILVSPEHDAEVRHVSITNTGSRVREIELTTYAEVVLTTSGADDAHPAFSKMFVQTEFLADAGALLATRRRREPADPELWLFHVSAVEGDAIGTLQFETDRARFLGRGNDVRNAASIFDAKPLSNSSGTVLDPVIALRRRMRVEPGRTARVAFWKGLAGSRAEALALADKHRDMTAFDRIKTLAWTQAQVQLRYLGVDFDEAQQFQRIANRVLYSDPSLRASRDTLSKNQLGPSVLWSLGISGDLPIVLLCVEDESDLNIVKQLLRAHEYWRLKRLAVDLVILNDHPPSYAAELQQAVEALVRTSQSRSGDEYGPGRGGVFSLRGDTTPAASRDLLQTAARAIFIGRLGRLSDQLARLRAPPTPRRRGPKNVSPAAHGDAPRGVPKLEFYNGFGGFSAAGREYVVILEEGQWTPAPWINVIANPQFGFHVSADGAGCTWSLNARENQLTPWSNDPVSNAPAEVIYLRDELSGDVWSATPLPIRDPTTSYLVRHGFGYTRFEHTSYGISIDLTQFVPLADPVKISRLKITNRSVETRQLSITHYVEWILGNQRSRTAPFIVTEIEPQTSALLARSPWNSEFQSRVAFMDMGGRQQACTGDRMEFLGRHGSPAEPAALLSGAELSNRVGGGLDPCGGLQSKLTLKPGAEIELVLLLGQEASKAEAVALIQSYRNIDLDKIIRAVYDFWDETVGVLSVSTPDRSMDVLLNGWLLYQTLVCRLWARSAFYQTSGAYGFRDQLQDVMALAVARPALTREHILRAASRQFAAGDVQHWWLPGSGKGVRTLVSDDRIWLPFVVAHYLEVTEDFALLEERTGFLVGAPLTAEQKEIFAAPEITTDTESLYEHCVRALDSSLALGSHGLPLFGTGDWNDGMNRVGAQGRGESVWLGWFLYATLLKFAPLAERRGDAARAARWREHALALQKAIERDAWDGDWYRRGYYDDGTPLGSVSSEECRIDSIAQSWSVISAGGDPIRAVRAMAAVNVQLVSRSDGLVQLFTPPFDRTSMDPGYVKAYPPGLRENGGQYTHAAMWATLAFALLDDGDRAVELFSLLNPINHASTRAGIHRYKVEPYVVCADVYSAAPHIGRGGWTWYTGSAGWMYRTAVEGILGIHLRGRSLRIEPCIPRAWPGFEVAFVHGSSRYHIAVANPGGVNRGIVHATLDERQLACNPCDVALVDDGSHHEVRITLG